MPALKKQQQDTKHYGNNKPWKALYKNKWYEVLDEEDQGPGKKNKYYLKGLQEPVYIEKLDPFGVAAEVNKDTILSILEKRYRDQPRAALESVTADVYYSGEPAAVLASDSVLDKLFDSYAKGTASKKRSASVDSNEFCPICKMATAKVKLSDNRPAKWCKLHHVVFPVKPENEK